MKKRTSRVSRRVVSLLMSLVLTLTLVTPAAFATEVVDGSGTTIVEGNTNQADANTSGDTEGDPEDDEIITDEEDADNGDIYDVQEDTAGYPPKRRISSTAMRRRKAITPIRSWRISRGRWPTSLRMRASPALRPKNGRTSCG